MNPPTAFANLAQDVLGVSGEIRCSVEQSAAGGGLRGQELGR